MAQPRPDRSAGPVDLGALRAAAAPVIAWYERLLGGEAMAVADLDTALRGLRGLPPIGGRLGRALALLATGGRAATTEEAVAALELLRSSAGLRPVPPPASALPRPRPATSAARRRRRAWTQPALPGLDPA